LTRYQKLLEDLQPYPEWRNKVMDDIGKRFLMIHNNLAEGEHKQEIFEKLVLKGLFRIVMTILYDLISVESTSYI
jgi:hypothetical protein